MMQECPNRPPGPQRQRRAFGVGGDICIPSKMGLGDISSPNATGAPTAWGAGGLVMAGAV